jgi:hypothetical protein
METHYGRTYIEQKVSEYPRIRTALHLLPLDLNYDTSNVSERIAFCIEVVTEELALERPGMKTRDGTFMERYLPKVQSIVPDKSNSNGMTLLGRAVDPENIDWGHVKSWLQICDSIHCSRSLTEEDLVLPVTPQILDLYEIDVESDCITKLSPNAQYIALSYMWGKDQRVKLKKGNIQAMSTPGFFSTLEGRPSRTIMDAMEVAKLLGCKYLWVDALCITQDDAATIQANVSNMDKVYAGAWITIVAASGEDADSGLPGVSRDLPRTQHQMRITVDGTTMANMLESEASAIDHSTWNTRGWTYQERLLSQRLLSFTLSQVYYHCGKGCDCREDTQRTMADGPATMTLFDRRFQFDFENDDLFSIYAIAVAEYTKRALTNSDDKMKVVDGLLNLLQRPFRGPFLFGIPTKLFDIGLLWIPTSHSNRRNMQFPSWSWAGWSGGVRYAQLATTTNICECTVPQATIESRNGAKLCSEPECAYLSLQDERNSQWKRQIDEETEAIYYTLPESDGYQYRYPRPLSKATENDRRHLTHENSRILKVDAMTSMFRLTDMHADMFLPMSTCFQGDHQQCYLSVHDSQGHVAGAIWIDKSTAHQLVNQNHKFLALSRSTLYRNEADVAWDDETKSFRPWNSFQSGVYKDTFDEDDEITNSLGQNISNSACFGGEFDINTPWPLLNVLLLSEPQNGVVERVGIGQIHVDAFLPAAKKETIMLG